MTSTIALRHKGRMYRITPAFALVREIEEELGGLAALERGFAQGAWRVTDLVALTQMLLQAAGETVDYIALGDDMVRGGVKPYLAAAQAFLRSVIGGKEKA